MKGCRFAIQFSDSAAAVIREAGSAITSAGGNFDGDEGTGTFELPTGIGSVKGRYTIADSVINIQISDKPLFVGCKKIEKTIIKYLQG